jgi:hypothetical protein
LLAEHNPPQPQPEVKKAKHKKPEVPIYGEPELPIDAEQEDEKE